MKQMPNAKKKIRDTFGREALERDGNTCRKCGRTDDIDAHHITDRHEMPNGGYVKENGITLCPDCHEKAEIYHSSGKEKWVPGFHPEELYKLIESSLEMAIQTSRRRQAPYSS